MKTELIRSKRIQEFQPFDFIISVETLREARLLFHVFNCDNLRDKIFISPYSVRSHYSGEVSEKMGEGYEQIRDEIKNQGFPL